MKWVKGFVERRNKQLLGLGVDQAALVGEPDHLVFGWSKIFTSFMERFKAWFHESAIPQNDRLRWIVNDKLPARIELRDYFHAKESETNRSEMLGYFASMLHLLHITDILNGQCAQSLSKRRRPQGEATMRDRAPKKEASPVAFIELLRISQEKVNKPVPNLSVP